MISHIKRVLTNPLLRMVYVHCSLPGHRRILAHRHRCIACVPMEPTVRTLKEGPVLYPQLHLLLLYSPKIINFGPGLGVRCWTVEEMFLSTPFLPCRAGPSPGLSCTMCSPSKKIFSFLVAAPYKCTLLEPDHLLERLTLFLVASLNAEDTVLPFLVYIVRNSSRSPQNTVQFQLRLLFRSTFGNPLQILLLHDVISNSLTPHPSNCNHPLQPQELLDTISALHCTVAGVVFC